MMGRDSKFASQNKLSKLTIESIKKSISILEKHITYEFKNENIKIKHFIEKIGDELKSNLVSLPKSLELIDEYFINLNKKLHNENIQGYFTLGDRTFQGLSLIIQWYYFVFIEAFISDDLANIHNNFDEKDIDKIKLVNESNAIQQKVNNFNKKLKEIEIQEYATSKFHIINYSVNDRNAFFSPIIKEELTLENKDNLSFQLVLESNSLKKQILAYELKSVTLIENFIQDENQKSKERLDLYNSPLGIDVYHLKEFQNNPALKDYDNITYNVQHSNINKIAQLINQYKSKKESFEISLKAYASFSSGSVGIANTIFHSINSTYHQKIKTTTIQDFEKKYQSKFDFIKNELPIKKDKMMAKFKEEAKPYLTKALASKDLANQYQQEVKENFDKRIHEFAESLTPLSNVDDIMEVRIDEIKKIKLNEVWDTIIHHMMNKELIFIKNTFLPIEQDKSEQNIKIVRSIRHHMWRTVKSILDNHIKQHGISKERSLELEKILFQNCAKISKNDIFERMDSYLGVPQKRKPATISHEQRLDTPPHPQDNFWKKTILYGLTICITLALCFTIYGLIVGLPLMLVTMSGWAGIASVGISGFLLPSIISYSKKYFCQATNVAKKPEIEIKPIHHSDNIISHSLPTQTIINNSENPSVSFSKPFFVKSSEKRELKIEEKNSNRYVI